MKCKCGNSKIFHKRKEGYICGMCGYYIKENKSDYELFLEELNIEKIDFQSKLNSQEVKNE